MPLIGLAPPEVDPMPNNTIGVDHYQHTLDYHTLGKEHHLMPNNTIGDSADQHTVDIDYYTEDCHTLEQHRMPNNTTGRHSESQNQTVLISGPQTEVFDAASDRE